MPPTGHYHPRRNLSLWPISVSTWPRQKETRPRIPSACLRLTFGALEALPGRTEARKDRASYLRPREHGNRIRVVKRGARRNDAHLSIRRGGSGRRHLPPLSLFRLSMATPRRDSHRSRMCFLLFSFLDWISIGCIVCWKFEKFIR